MPELKSTDFQIAESRSMAVAWKRLSGVALAAALMCLVGFADVAYGQRLQDRQFRPARPTMSPYMGLLQTNIGPIPNFFSLVRPMMQQQAFNRQLQQTTASQSLQIQSLSGQAAGQQATPQTGKHAGFNQTLHFFPPQRSPAR